MRLYIEMLALCLIDAQFLLLLAERSTNALHLQGSSGQKRGGGSSAQPGPALRQQHHHHTDRLAEYLSAARQVENLLGTHRDSVVGTGAWSGQYNQKHFHRQLLARPFFHCQGISVGFSSSNSGGDEHSVDSDAADSATNRRRCDACGRTAHRPDVEVHCIAAYLHHHIAALLHCLL